MHDIGFKRLIKSDIYHLQQNDGIKLSYNHYKYLKAS